MAASRTSSVQAERDIIDLPLEVKAGGMPGEFEGYGAVFGNVDRDGDVVTKGAFASSLKERLPALLWQHNPKQPIGRFDVVREDAKGLFVKGRLSQTGKGAEAYELLKMGALNGLSIGFVTKEAQRSSASGARQITRADLMEVSLVTFPANELARVQTVKQKEPALNSQTDIEDPSIRDPRSFERFLRENGFSRSRAKAITAKGFKSGDGLASKEDTAVLSDMLKKSAQRIEMKNIPYFELEANSKSRICTFKPSSSPARVDMGESISEQPEGTRYDDLVIDIWVLVPTRPGQPAIWQHQRAVKGKHLFTIDIPGFNQLTDAEKNRGALRLQFIGKYKRRFNVTVS
ncbi:HK97 family phage prohead protease [Kordiimonas aquimaris]|uniref:HK97 family phage prohead protease n=1 Tax=Kordiimonas aquimaris TaxID=707591 RepID=UPI0021D0A1C7|nr:HK97 family phage prohead protease [Kordiimonas aquimaris]